MPRDRRLIVARSQRLLKSVGEGVRPLPRAGGQGKVGGVRLCEFRRQEVPMKRLMSLVLVGLVIGVIVMVVRKQGSTV